MPMAVDDANFCHAGSWVVGFLLTVLSRWYYKPVFSGHDGGAAILSSSMLPQALKIVVVAQQHNYIPSWL
jgi:hypothetical protein